MTTDPALGDDVFASKVDVEDPALGDVDAFPAVAKVVVDGPGYVKVDVTDPDLVMSTLGQNFESFTAREAGSGQAIVFGGGWI